MEKNIKLQEQINVLRTEGGEVKNITITGEVVITGKYTA